MKTNRNTKHIIILIFAIFLAGCTKEINNSLIEEASETEIASDSPQEEASLIVSQNEVSSNEIPNVISHLRNKIGSKYFRSERSETTNENEPIIDYEHITAVLDTLRNTNYSINFVMPNGQKNTFYNLVIGVDSLGAVTDPIVVKYVLDEEQEQMFIDSGYDFSFFKGSIALENYSKYFSSNIFLASDTHCNQEFDENGDPLPCDILDVNNTGSSGGSEGGSFDGSNTNSSSSTESPAAGGVACSVEYVWNGCGGSNTDTEHGSGVCGGNGNGAGWVVYITCPNSDTFTPMDQSRYTNSQDTSECPSCNIGPSGPSGVNLSEIARIYHLIDVMKQNNVTFTAAEEFFLRQQSNFAITEQIYSFWYSSERDAVIIMFIKEAIKALENNGTVDFTERLIDDPSLYEMLIRNMSVTERQIYDNELDNSQKALYLSSAVQAFVYAEIFYPQPVRNRIGDAIKHAMWNALSTSRIGEALTKRLTDAHENIEYDPFYENHFKETEMDFFNNPVGRQIGRNQPAGIYLLIEAARRNGQLRHLNNLMFKNGFFNATNQSILVPTN